MIMKKAIALLLVIALTAAVAIGGTLAYLTDRENETNVFTMGDVKIELDNEFKQGIELTPGVAVNNTITITNTGKNDAWVWYAVKFDKCDSSVIDVRNIGAEWTQQVSSEYGNVQLLKAPLAAGKSETVAMQIELDPTVDIAPDGKLYKVVGGDVTDLRWNVSAGNPVAYINAYAIQTDTFNTVEDAYAAYIAQWGGLNGEKPTVVATDSELKDALAAGKPVVLANDITLDAAVSAEKAVNIDLNGNTLSTVGLELKAGGTMEDGTVASAGNTNLAPHLRISGGNFEMSDVVVEVTHHLNANVNWTEATGMEIANATAVLNNCRISIYNQTKAKWVYSYGLSINNATVTVNGGSITAACVPGTAANGPTNPNAISAMNACTVTLNGVTVDADYYATTVNGHLTINTTEKTVTSADVVDNRGGSHTINYID